MPLTPRKALLAGLVLLLSTGALRLVHLDWGLPAIEEEALPAKKAFEMWGWETGSLRLDPQTAGWPAFSFYVQLAAQKADYLLGRATGRFHDALDYYVAYELDPSAVILLGRTVSALASLVVVLVAFVLGRRFGGLTGGLLAGLLTGGSPLLLRNAQMIEPDLWVVVFSALAVWKILDVLATGATKNYVWAGLFAGLGTASKYTPLLLAVSLYLVHLERRRVEGRPVGLLGLDDRRLGWAALATLLAFVLATPFTFADLDVLRRDFAYQAMHMSAGHFGHESQGVGYGHYLRTVLPHALGWPAFVLGLVGLFGALRRRRREERALLWSFAPLFLVLGSLSTHFDRYMLPLVLPLTLGVVVTVQWLREGKMSSLLQRGVVRGAVVIALVALPWIGSAKHLQLQGTPGTQELARQWVEEHVDARTTTLALEYYGPMLPYDQRSALQQNPVFARLDEEQRAELLARPFYRYLTIPMYSARVEYTAYYYDLAHFLEYDFIVTSGGVRSRYQANERRFPRQNQFYRDLEKYCEIAHAVRPGQQARGAEIRFHRWTEEGKQRFLSERGRLPVDHYRDWGSRVHVPDFLAFVEAVAAHAELKEAYTTAGNYFEILGETLPPLQQASAVERAGVNRLNAGDLEDAEGLFERALRMDRGSVLAIGNLGVIAERRGDFALARERFETCQQNAKDDRTRSWVAMRLRRLEALESSGTEPRAEDQ